VRASFFQQQYLDFELPIHAQALSAWRDFEASLTIEAAESVQAGRGKPRQLASTELTRRRLAWELQAVARGGLDAGTRRRLRQLSMALKPDASLSPLSDINAKPGTVLSRDWSGATHKVVVLEAGFGWNGQTWKSLSEIATKITGTRWSGPRFFGLKQRSDK
jgi:hypothetical protein